MKGILTDSVAVADAIARSNLFASRDPLNRSLLPTDQKLAGLDSTLPGIRMNQDGGVTVWFAAQAPTGEEKNWVQTIPGKGYNVALRLYGPLEPWLNQTWRAGDIEPLH